MNILSEEYNKIYSRKNYHYQKHYSKSPYLRVWEKVSSYIDVDMSVVDIGCGTGQVMDLLLDKGIKNYTGYDFSIEAINLSYKVLGERSATLVYQDLYELNSFNDADIYISIEVLEHLVDDFSVLNKIPKGKRIVITVPNYLGGSHVRKFDSKHDVLSRYEDIIESKEISVIERGNSKIFILYGITK